MTLPNHKSIFDELSSIYPEVSDLLRECWQLNPKFRSPASILMKHKLFDSVREARKEKEARYRIKLRVDKPGNYDYLNFQSVFPQASFLKMFKEEIRKINNCRGNRLL